MHFRSPREVKCRESLNRCRNMATFGKVSPWVCKCSIIIWSNSNSRRNLTIWNFHHPLIINLNLRRGSHTFLSRRNNLHPQNKLPDNLNELISLNEMKTKSPRKRSDIPFHKQVFESLIVWFNCASIRGV